MAGSSQTLTNIEYSPFNKSKPKRHPGPWHCVFKGQSWRSWRGCRTPLIWMCGVVPCGSATAPGIFYRAELGTGVQIPWGSSTGKCQHVERTPKAGDEFSE